MHRPNPSARREGPRTLRRFIQRALTSASLLPLFFSTGCSTDLGEVADLATSGGESAEPVSEMRAIRGTTRALIIALDGVGEGAFDAALAVGRLPALEQILGAPVDGDANVREHAYLAREVSTTLPSTTMAAWATIFTGSTPGEHGIIGNEWFDRTTAVFYAPGPVSVRGSTHTVQIYTDDLVGTQLGGSTLFERIELRSHVSLGQIHRGADVLTYPDGLDLAEIFGGFAEGLFSAHGIEGEAYEHMDQESIGPLLAAIDQYGVPDVQVVYFPGVDLITHASDPPHDVQQNHLETIVQPALARVFAAYRDAGALEDLYVFVIADHGHTPVDPGRALGAQPSDGVPSALAEAGFVLRPPQLAVEGTAFSAVLAYQGGVANIYLADRRTCPDLATQPGGCDWQAPPRYEEDVLPAARALLESEALSDALELVLVREPRPAGETQARFAVLTRDGVVGVAEHLRASPRPDWIDFEARLRDLSNGPMGHRAGDVLLVSRLDLTIPREQRTYFSGAYHSWHGSPTRQDSHVPFVVAHPSRSGTELERVVERALRPRRSTLAFAPLVERLLAER